MLINVPFFFFYLSHSEQKRHKSALKLGANVFIDNSFAWKTPAPSCEFPLTSINGFTPLTNPVAAKTNIFFFYLWVFFRRTSETFLTLYIKIAPFQTLGSLELPGVHLQNVWVRLSFYKITGDNFCYAHKNTTVPLNYVHFCLRFISDGWNCWTFGE